MVFKISSTRQPGFTLIELIIVIAIIAIIAGAVFVAINPAKRMQQARDSAASSNAQQIDKAVQLYMTDNGTAIPSTAYYNGIIPTTTTSLQVCAQGTAPNVNCMSLDFLINATTGKYLPAIKSLANQPTGLSGYSVAYNKGVYVGISAATSGTNTAIVYRPTGQVNTLWSVYDYNRWIQPGDFVLQPTVPASLDITNDFVDALNSTGTDGSGDSGERQVYGFGSIAAASQLTVWFYGQCNNITPQALTIDATINGGAPVSMVALTSASTTWRSVTLPGPFTAGTLQLGITVPSISSGLLRGCLITTLYISATP